MGSLQCAQAISLHQCFFFNIFGRYTKVKLFALLQYHTLKNSFCCHHIPSFSDFHCIIRGRGSQEAMKLGFPAKG